MPKARPPYAPEFRRQIELVRASRTPESLSREFEPSAQAIHNLAQQADRDEGRHDGATSAERQELVRLRRENKRLRQEREILAKAVAWLASTARGVLLIARQRVGNDVVDFRPPVAIAECLDVNEVLRGA